jgi:phage terminase large subunit-like protein
VDSSGPELSDWARQQGMPMDPWQDLCLDVACAERRDGHWAATNYGLLVSRQNGKGTLMEVRGLGGLFLFGEKTILYSCHEFKTAEEYFERVKAWIDNTDDMRKRVKSMPAAHGQEAIKLIGGAKMKIIARTSSSGRGFSADTLLFDEAQDLPRKALRSQMYTQGARPNAQRWFTGTAPEPDAGEEADVFLDIIAAGRDGGSATAAYTEWSSGDRWPDDVAEQIAMVNDRAGWAAANPALGWRITEETILGELETSGTDYAGFARERLSISPPRRKNVLIPASAVEAAFDPASAAAGRVVFGIDMPPDRSAVSISVAGRRADGRFHLEVIRKQAGSSWVPGFMRDLFARNGTSVVMIDKAGAAASLLGSLATVGINAETTTTQQYTQACGGMFDALTEAFTVLFRGDPDLVDAMASVGKRNLGDAWAFDRKGVADISPLCAATLAMYGLINLPDPVSVYEERDLRVLD